MFEPSVVVLYVENVHKTSEFYQKILGTRPAEDSPTFHAFRLSNGMIIGLKAKETIHPAGEKNGSGELAFVIQDDQQVDQLFLDWQKQQIKMLHDPIDVNYGYSFLAQDPDGNRLRVVALKK